MSSDVRLGVNIDHVATLREARGTHYPDPLEAAFLAAANGADGITMHLREDRRHIRDRDVERVAEHVDARLNLEMAATPDMVATACRIRPHDCCLVPERRAELTTEGGLDVALQEDTLRAACDELARAGIRVSLFIDAREEQIAAAARLGVAAVELHTGPYAEADSDAGRAAELATLRAAVRSARAAGLIVNAGHGLHYHNVEAVAALYGLHELNIGHAIIARAVMCGLPAAVTRMRALIRGASAAGTC